MWHEERQRRIRSMLATFGRLSIDQVTEDFGVSRETIRRDFMDMEEAGELRRVRGGVVPAADDAEAPYLERAAVRRREKLIIAKAAAALVEAGQTIFLDAGSTTTILAERLAQLNGLTVVTNSFDVAKCMTSSKDMAQRKNRVVFLGGEFADNPSATYGAITINEIARYRADFAIVSPFGLDVSSGATSYNPDEAEIARAMFANARQRIILADHSKLGVASRVSFCASTEPDIIIVDPKSRQSQALAKIEAVSPCVIVA
ncbi:DeoR/GlpR family DNA-binding transcription regulator [Corticibacterium sp. UT-5YL-CI-8]|nr:DeoR/GlpR family DNA-binding transcription regulator [Tianweitania sp. UT-5YL-CI-8]